jgi:hypothetical protein
MKLENKSDIVVGVRCYDSESSFNVHLIGHCGDSTKNLYQRRLTIAKDQDVQFFPKERLERVKYDRFMNTRISVYEE